MQKLRESRLTSILSSHGRVRGAPPSSAKTAARMYESGACGATRSALAASRACAAMCRVHSSCGPDVLESYGVRT